jgi:hypothetical protein
VGIFRQLRSRNKAPYTLNKFLIRGFYRVLRDSPQIATIEPSLIYLTRRYTDPLGP